MSTTQIIRFDGKNRVARNDAREGTKSHVRFCVYVCVCARAHAAIGETGYESDPKTNELEQDEDPDLSMRIAVGAGKRNIARMFELYMYYTYRSAQW